MQILNLRNQANQDLLAADDDDTEELFSSDRSAVDQKKVLENVDEIFSLEDISGEAGVVRERTFTKEDEELARLVEEEKLAVST
jgi:hypothetical protein